MIELLTHTNPGLMQRLADYLETQGIACQLSQSELGVTLWLVDESRWPQADSEVNRFIREPEHPRYREASWALGHTQNRVQLGSMLQQPLTDLLHQAGPWTLIWLVISIAVYAAQQLGLPIYQLLAYHTDLMQLNDWQLWRLFTPVLMHLSLTHLIFNLLWWWYLGGALELRLGAGKLLLLLAVSALISNGAEYLLSGPLFGGLSGVVYALLGYRWILGSQQPESELAVSSSLVGFMLLWLILGFTGLLGATGNWAHLSGLLVGMTQGFLDRRQSY